VLGQPATIALLESRALCGRACVDMDVVLRVCSLVKSFLRSVVATAATTTHSVAPPVTLGLFTTTLRVRLRCCQPGCLPHFLLAHNRSPYHQSLALPYGISGGRAVITPDGT